MNEIAYAKEKHKHITHSHTPSPWV